MKALPIALGVLAVATAIPAWWPAPDITYTSQDLSGQQIGETVPAANIDRFRILRWNTESEQVDGIEVKQIDKDWVISSHHNYPADGGTRVGDTFGSMLGLTYGRLVTKEKSKHKETGVRDPEGAEENGGDGCGDRISLWDKGGKSVLDLIIGEEVPNQPGQYYVREAGSDAVYTCSLVVDFRMDFKDWVETDLMQIEKDDIVSFVRDEHSVDEAQGQLVNGPKTEFIKNGEDWASLTVPEGKEIDADLVATLLDKLSSLRITNAEPRVTNQVALMEKGFFVDNVGNVYGNVGAIRVQAQNGILYHLFFGEIADANQEGDSGPDRSMAIFVSYNQAADTELPTAEEPVEGEETKTITLEERIAAHVKEREALLAERNERFSAFFYVISGEDFDILSKKGADYLKDKEVAAEPAAVDDGPAIPAPKL